MRDFNMKNISKTAVIAEGVIIGDNCQIGEYVVIEADTVIGANVRIDAFAHIGKTPMKAANSAVTKESELDPCVIGDGCIIGTHAVVYRGCTLNEGVLVADMGEVRERVTVGEKTIIGKGATVECDCKVGSYCKIQTNAYITAYSTLGNYCFIAPGVVTSNDNYAGRTKKCFAEFKGVTVCDGGRIGAGAVIKPGIVIGEDGFVAAGSVVTRDVEPGMIVMGVPAKTVRKVDEEQLLKNQ